MRNVILVTYDSLRADHCGYWGYERCTTPTIDRMAREGLVFDNAIAPGPSTPESMPTILTGHYQTPLEGDSDTLLSARQRQITHTMQARETLAERLSRVGFQTAAFSPNPYTSRYFGFESGFDHFEDFMDGSRRKLYNRLFGGVLNETPLSTLLPARILLNWVQREEVFKPWEAYYDEIISFTENATEPYFLWVLLMDTHDPYLPGSEYLTQSRWKTYHSNLRLWLQNHEPPFSEDVHNGLIRAYDDATSYADAFLERLSRDVSDDTAFIIHADHGEAFGEHGTYGHHPQLYEENVHVPLVVWNAGWEGVVTKPTSLSLIPELTTMVAREREAPNTDEWPAFATSRTLDEDRVSFRGVRWKYIRNDTHDELYDLEHGEDEPVDEPEVKATFERLSDRWLQGEDENRTIGAAAENVVEEALL